MHHIGFVGASGLMGHGMAKNILARGYDLSISVHRRAEPVQDLLDAGAHRVASPADLAACDAVLICVTGSPEVEAVVAGPSGLLTKARQGLIIIDTSTSEPESTHRLAAMCAERGVVYVDAPLTRTPVEAEQGRLNTMVGASQAVFETLSPLLQTYCENVFHVGDTGAGHVIKLLNNFIAQAICTATAEALAVGTRAGVDVRQLVRVVSAGGANSGLFQAMARTLDGDFGGLNFELNNAAKDLRYYGHLTERLKAPSWIGSPVHQALNLAVALGYGSERVPSLVKAQAQLNGIRIGQG